MAKKRGVSEGFTKSDVHLSFINCSIRLITHRTLL
jgi:hypothetical protein